jgi:hypothetical protein
LPQGNLKFSLYSGLANEQATVTTEKAFSGTKSLKFSNTSDIFFNINRKIESPARLEWKTFLESGKTGSWALHTNSQNVPALIVRFNNGQGSVNTISNNNQLTELAKFTYQPNTWTKTVLIFNNKSNSIEVWVGNKFIVSIQNYQSHLVSKLSLYGTPNISTNSFYIEDLLYYETELPCMVTANIDPVCVNGAKFDNRSYAWCEGYSDDEITSCLTENENICTNGTVITCGLTISGTTIGETYKFYRPDYSNCLPQNNANDFQAADKIYKFTHTGGSVGIHLWGKTPGVDLDVFLLRKCGKPWSPTFSVVLSVPPNTQPNQEIECIASGISTNNGSFDDDFIEVQNLPAGEYFIVVDGQVKEGEFDLSLTCGNLNCNNSTIISCGQSLRNQNNSTGTNNVSVYCTPAKQPGGSTANLPSGAGCTARERVYRFTPAISGEVEINLTNFSQESNLELFLFNTCSQFSCLARSTKPKGQNEQIKYIVQAGITYYIVVDGYQGSSSNYDLSINCCEVVYKSCPEVDFKHYYSGNGSDLKFTFTTNISKAPNERWKVLTPNGVDIGGVLGNSNNFEFSFQSSGNYEICIPLIDQNGCLQYCCYKVFISNPFDCNLLNFRFNDVNETYEINSSTTGGQLFEHNAGQQPFAVSNVINRPPNNNNCIRTYFYWYQINGVYRLCYIRINICDPFDCGDQNIKYDFNEQTEKFDFTLLEGSKYTNIKWTAKEEISTEIGNTPSVSFYPIGRDCRVYTISVSYYDPATRTFRICCIRVFLCNPFNCNPLNLSYDEEKNEYTFGISGSDVTNFDWVLKPNNLSLGNQQSVTFKPSVGFPCNTYTVSVKYRVGNSWRFCCWKVRICNPKDCGSLISHTYNNGQLNLTTNQNYQQVSWLLNGNKIQNPSNVNPGTYRVCLIYFDPATKAYFVCCKEVTLVNMQNNPCETASIIECGATISGTTIGETYKFYRPDYSNCLPQNSANDFQAADKIYKFTHTGGSVGIHLWGKTPGVDLDVFLLRKCGKPWSPNIYML